MLYRGLTNQLRIYNIQASLASVPQNQLILKCQAYKRHITFKPLNNIFQTQCKITTKQTMVSWTRKSVFEISSFHSQLNFMYHPSIMIPETYSKIMLFSRVNGFRKPEPTVWHWRIGMEVTPKTWTNGCWKMNKAENCLGNKFQHYNSVHPRCRIEEIDIVRLQIHQAYNLQHSSNSNHDFFCFVLLGRFLIMQT